MELTKAIEILQDLLGEGPQYPPDDRREAVKLGIGALKRINIMRSYNISQAIIPLLGEQSIEAPGLSDDRILRLKESPLARPEDE